MLAIVDLDNEMSAWAALISRSSHRCAGLIIVLADEVSGTVSHYLSDEQRFDDKVDKSLGPYANGPYLIRAAQDPSRDNPKLFGTVKNAEKWLKRVSEETAGEFQGRPTLAFWIFPECFPEQSPSEKYQMFERQFPGSVQQ